MPLVDSARVMSASRRVRKTGAVPVFGFTRAKSSGVNGKQRSGSSWTGFRVMQEESAFSVWSNLSLLATQNNEGAEFEPKGLHPGKKGGKSVPRRRFSKSSTSSNTVYWLKTDLKESEPQSCRHKCLMASAGRYQAIRLRSDSWPAQRTSEYRLMSTAT